MSDKYSAFLKDKSRLLQPMGINVADVDINPMLFPFQRDLVRWAVRKGRCAIFADTGLGKTLMQLEWARLMAQRSLIVAPLSVARQTVRQAEKMGLSVHYVTSQDGVTGDGIWITNYERINAFDMARFGAVVLDESSILKALDGQTRKLLTTICADIPYRLCCTATPAPNDYIELGNHAEFLGVCTQSEMLAMFFINANKDAAIRWGDVIYKKKGPNSGGTEWRLKHHAETPFFRWLSSWAISLTLPSDLGYDDNGFILPPLNIEPVVIPTEYTPTDELIFTHLKGITDRTRVRRDMLPQRMDSLRELIARHDGQWIIWVGLAAESKAVAEALPDSVEVKGNDDPEHKAQAFEDFQDGKVRILVTKGRIGGFGMNFQNAHNMAFFGINDSWEQWYQCIRRQWRFGQTEPVNVFPIFADVEREIYQNIQRKDMLALRLKRSMIEQIRGYEVEELLAREHTDDAYVEQDASGERWALKMGDSCKRLGELATDSVDLSVYSPPFADLYTYSNSERDLGNNRNWREFFEHYAFIIREVLRVTRPGRLTCVHTSDIPAMAQKDGYVGVKDFPGDVIRAYDSNGWIFVGRCFIQKNPQAQAIRVHASSLLFAGLQRDSTGSRPALVDQILLFKKPGENTIPVLPQKGSGVSNELWIEWANGIWTDIRETDTLQYNDVRRAEGDDKHICPLQLATIERCIRLWSNPGELVLDPFTGIGSTGYVALQQGRRFIGIELKPSYWESARRNLENVTAMASAMLFDVAAYVPVQ